jgi:hypothetical protein
MPALPKTAEFSIALLSALGIPEADQRNAVAVLALIGAGLDPEKVVRSRSRDRARLSEGLNLDVTGWPRVIAGLEAQGIISTPGRDGRRGIVR